MFKGTMKAQMSLFGREQKSHCVVLLELGEDLEVVSAYAWDIERTKQDLGSGVPTMRYHGQVEEDCYFRCVIKPDDPLAVVRDANTDLPPILNVSDCP